MDEKSLAATRFQFAQSVFNHKIQEKAADRKYEYAKWFKVIQLVLTAVVIGVLIAQAAGWGNAVISAVGIIAGGVEIVFLIVDLTYGFEKQAAAHKAYALKYLDLCVQYQALIADIMAKQGVSQINNAKRDALDSILYALSSAPQTTPKDYQNAQKALGTDGESGGEQYTWSDKEINKFLTPQLRYTSKSSSRSK